MRKLLQVTVSCFLFLTAFVYGQAQSKIITGKIAGTDGQPLNGVSILVKGSKIGVASDAQGTYLMTVAENAKVLVFSIVGYTPQEIPIQGRTSIDVVLQINNGSTLDDVVVVGYGTVKKSDLTGAVGSVKGADLNKLPTQRIDQALQGRTAGVLVQNTDGAPGGNTTIRIRGSNSITGGNNALVVVDGLQGVNISTLNPNDIESLEVLKDASATAIYGARGANGVILITTKKGVAGKPLVSYGYNNGTQKIAKKMDLMNAGEYARRVNAFAATQDLNGSGNVIIPILPFTTAQIADLDKTGGTDWQDEIFRKGNVQNHLLSISGGSENIRYFVSGGMTNQKGVLINTAYKRYTLRSNLDAKINSWLSAGVNLNLIKDKGNVPPFGEGARNGNIFGQAINTAVRFDPTTAVYSSSGLYNFKANKGGPLNNKSYADNDVWNPVAAALETFAERNTGSSDISTFLEFKLLEGLSLRVTGAASIQNFDNKVYNNTKTQSGSVANGAGISSEDKFSYFQNSNILTYNKTFAKKHRLTLTGVAEQQLSIGNGSSVEANDFFSDRIGIFDLGGAKNRTPTNYDSKQTLNSYLGRVNYVFDNKYMLTASFRADGSSVFGANNKWGFFPAAAVAWKASEEKFIKNLNLFSTLKFRGSYGKTGNQAIQPYGSLSIIGSGFNYPFDGSGSTDIGYQITRLGNPLLKWESTDQTNIGIDLGFFNDRLTFTADVYKKTTTDLLLNKLQPGYAGVSSIITNVGSVENKGLEISLGAKPIAGKDFYWNTNFNISFNKGKVLALASNAPLAIRTNTGAGYNIFSNNFSLKFLQAGHPLGEMRGFVNLGTWGSDEANEAKLFGQLPGDAKWKDVDADGKIDIKDGNEIIGNVVPDFIYGWSNNLSYKNFDLSFLIQGTYGNDVFNAVRIKSEGASVGTSSALNNGWSSTNQNTAIPALIKASDRQAAQVGASKILIRSGDSRSSRWVEDGSYVRLRNITLTYNLPVTLLTKIHIDRLSAFVTGANLVTLTKYTGYDPEVSSFNIGNDSGAGIDLSNYPSSKSVVFGFNLTF
ncbi:TonB-dependent receptor [soil metagenome]